MPSLIDKYVNALLTREEVKGIEKQVDGDISWINFNYKVNNKLYKLAMLLEGDNYPFIISEDNLEEIPHTSPPLIRGKLNHLCLFNSSSLVSNGKTIEEKVDYIIDRLKTLFSMSEVEKKREYKKEYLYYWNNMSENKHDYNIFSDEETMDLNLYRKKGKESKYFLVGDNKVLNDYYTSILKKKNIPCVRVEIPNNKLILPPVNKKWNKDDVVGLLDSLSAGERSKIYNLEIPEDEVYIVFSLNIRGILPLNLLLKITFKNKVKRKFVDKIKGIKEVQHLSSKSSGVESLFQRIGDRLNRKKVLIVGYGSLGSYIAEELPSLGVTELTIYDYDSLEPANIYRHRLGFNSILGDSVKKSDIAKQVIENNYPEVYVTSHSETFDVEKIEDVYDLIIINTGEVDLQLKFNRDFKKKKIKVPVLYNWLEYRGIGAHSLLVDYSKEGCFKCLYGNGSRNKHHFYTGKIELPTLGCGGSFNPYGNQILLKGTSMAIDVIKDIFKNKFNDNLLFSSKLTSYSEIRLEDLSSRYGLDSDTLAQGTDDYINTACEVCSDEGVSS